MAKKKVKVGINGFGRIGRTLFRLAQSRDDIEVVAINDLWHTEGLAHLLQFDSIHGALSSNIDCDNENLFIGDQSVRVYHKDHPKHINWSEENVDVVVESTGKFKKREDLNHHLKNGAKKVILAVPPVDESIKMLVLGVNQQILEANDNIVSNASCTTNNAAPMIKVVNELCQIEQAYITTVHSFTNDQNLHDAPHRDLRRARAAAQSIIPTTTGAAKALTKIFPDLSNNIGGCGIRVPVANGSLTDITFNVKKTTTVEQINRTFKEKAANQLNGILFYTDKPIVSIDINNSPYSCTFDSKMTSVIDKMVKVIGWYDNETGYSSRVLDLIQLMSKKGYL